MADYLPLCAFRLGLLPTTCSSCVWWLTTGTQRYSPRVAAGKRREWMANMERTWGATGLLLEGDGSTSRAGRVPAPAIAASISFAPVGAVPRMRELGFGPLSQNSALVFCSTVTEGQPRTQAKRVLNKALDQLKSRGAEEVYALARPADAPDDSAACRFFPLEFLAASGFEDVAVSGTLVLMRVDLRGILSLVDRVETAVKRILRNEPTPSPAAWTRRGT